ncbi:MAG: hypothetical protein M3237_11490 [Actinomycetota bacterium]|nr:hypothetical protein [Actinomycetota bacterium]
MTQPPRQPVPPQQPARPASAHPMPTQPPPGYDPPPPPDGHPSPPPPGSLHRSSKGRTIGIIVAGVVGVGVLGGLGAVIFGGGDAKDDDVTTSEAKGNGSGILDPEPVGTATPEPDPTVEPTDTPTTDPTPTPEPTSEPTTPPVEGDTETIGAGVQVFVPSGWEVTGRGNDDVGLSDGDGSWAYALTGVDDPSVEASAVLSANLDTMLPADNYSQLETGDVRPLEAFGSVVSVAVMDYEALWVDAQASIPLHGQVYVAVRQDGVVLLIAVEHTPPGDFTASIGDWGQVVDNSFNLLGGS